MALPGSYTVRLEVGGQSSSQTFQIVGEPRRPMTPEDRRVRQEALMSLHALAKPLADAIEAGNRLNGQLGEVRELLDGREDAPQALKDELAAIRDTLRVVRDGLAEARRNAGVAGAIQQSSTRPTEDQLWQVDAAWSSAPDLIARLNGLLTDRVPAFHRRLDQEGIRPEAGAAIQVPVRPGGGG